MATDVQRLNGVLSPAAPPRVTQYLYTEDQRERMLGVIRGRGPWPTIGAHHVDTVEARPGRHPRLDCSLLDHPREGLGPPRRLTVSAAAPTPRIHRHDQECLHEHA